MKRYLLLLILFLTTLKGYFYVGAINTSNTISLHINYATWGGGASNSNGRFGGEIDEVRIYNRAITNDEVLQIYNAEKP